MFFKKKIEKFQFPPSAPVLPIFLPNSDVPVILELSGPSGAGPIFEIFEFLNFEVIQNYSLRSKSCITAKHC